MYNISAGHYSSHRDRDNSLLYTCRLNWHSLREWSQYTENRDPDRPQRWSIFQSDGMVNVFFQATIDFNGFSMVLIPLDHHHWMFLEGPTIGFNGFSMVLEILRAMVNDGLEVNNGLHVPSHKKVRKINSRQNANFKQSTQMNISEHLRAQGISRVWFATACVAMIIND